MHIGRFAKGLGLGLLAGIVLAVLYIQVSGKKYLYKALYHNVADIDDNLIFEERKIPAPNPQPWPLSAHYNKRKLDPAFLAQQEKLESVAFLVVCRDSILQENYWDGYGPKSLSNSFSVAKTVVSMLVGVALKEGKIRSVDESVGNFLPEFRNGKKANITIRHLLTMSSGLNWEESYSNPLAMTTEAYYGDDIKSLLARQEVLTEPGREFLYLSGNTEILAFMLEKATGKNISEYASEKLWKPLGAEQAAEWSLDKKDGMEKAYCCFFSNARDFARLGQLYLQNGIWKGDTLISPEYVKASVTPTGMKSALSGDPGDFYGYSWWLIPDYKGHRIFYARGILGQYVIAIPDKKLVVVRLGVKRGPKTGMHYQDIYDLADAAFSICE